MTTPQELDPERSNLIAEELNTYAQLLREAATGADALATNFRSIDPDDPLGVNATLDPKQLLSEAVNLAARTTRESRVRAERMAARATQGPGAISMAKAARLLGMSINTFRRRLPSKAPTTDTAAVEHAAPF